MPVNNIGAAGISPMPVNPGGRQAKTELGKDDFLKLIAGQLKHQDPSSAGGGEEFMAQMTQFAMLEQLQNLAAETKVATAAANAGQANGLIGKTVVHNDPDGNPVEAKVQSVVFAEGAPMLRLEGHEDPIAVSAVVEVK